jgi:glycosyltransferase involved in cell wall biosynthesis
MKRVCIVLMDDPVYKQSCIRVAEALSGAGYAVTLIGRRTGPVDGDKAFKRVRFRTMFREGKVFYGEMNLRIFLYLLFHRVDAVCAVNLDTILPCYTISVLKRIPRVYDARELFSELAEVVARPRIQRAWRQVEKSMVPRFPNGYAVCASIGAELHRRYGVNYSVVRNMTVLSNRVPGRPPLDHPYLLYQGAVNYGRGLDALIPAMQYIDMPLLICGTGNYLQPTRDLILHYGLGDRVLLLGQLAPAQLFTYTAHAYAGINLVERDGFNQYYSLPNKLFDYIHAGLPQVTMDYPEYRRVQESYEVAVLIPEVRMDLIVGAVKSLVGNPELYARLKANCALARLEFNWQREAPVVLEIYQKLLPHA